MDYLFGSDEHYQANTDILDGVRFCATLKIRTPLAVLMHHNELFRGPPSAAPNYGTVADGIWLPNVRTFRERGLDIPEFPSKHASDIGPVFPSDYLPFLVSFRKIVEDESSHTRKLGELGILRKQSSHNAAIWKKLESSYLDFPHSFFYHEFMKISGVGPKTAKLLYEKGFTSIAEISTATSEELRAAGFAEGTVTKIVASFNDSSKI